MRNHSAESATVSISVYFYRLVLVLYPTSFRREYGPHMLQVFRDCSLRSYNRSGPSGMLSLWALTLLDLLRSTVEQYLQRETFMSRNTLVRLSGWAMAIGGAATGFAFMIFMLTGWMKTVPKGTAWEAILVVAFFYGPIGVGLGLLGVRSRFGSAVGSLGQGALLIGATIGTALIVIGDVVQSLPNNLDDNGFGYFMYGLFVVFVALELYGVLALVYKPQARWNALALVAGLPITATAVLVALPGSGGTGPNPFPDPLAVVSAVTFAVMGVALAMLGSTVQSDLPEEITAEPARA
jgi:hypothetical protein